MKSLELGVFLPVASSGFIMSINGPQYRPTFELNRDISVLAEELGLGYVFSMAKWRGFGGESEMWDHTLESISLMSAIAAVTSKIRVIATVNPLIYHPAVVAKMAATLCDISKGRLGLNIITGASLEEYGQMGVVPEGYATDRYGFATEWLDVVRRLWTESSVTHHGKYFDLDDCVSLPKPERPPFLVCAGLSDEGIRFSSKETDYLFINGRDADQIREYSVRAKGIAREEGHDLKTAACVLVIQGESTEHAAGRYAHIIEGADDVAVGNMLALWGGTGSRESVHERMRTVLSDPNRVSIVGKPLVGDEDTLVDEITSLARDGEVDNILLIFDDYLADLRLFGDTVLPRLNKAFEMGVATGGLSV